MSHRVCLLAFLMFFGLAPMTVGCGDDTPTVSRRRGGKKKRRKKRAKAPALDMSNLPAKLRKADWGSPARAVNQGKEARDPFLPQVGELLGPVVNDDDEAKKKKDATRRPGPRIKLGNYDVQELALIGIITGGAVNKAMVTDPSGVGHIVRTGEVVGRPPMRVARITRNEVLFRPLSNDKDAGREVQKVLLTQEELAEVLP